MCLAVEFVPEGGSWPWVALVGLQGWDAGGPTLQSGQTSEARRAGGRWKEVDRRAVAAEAGDGEPEPAGAAGSRSGAGA